MDLPDLYPREREVTNEQMEAIVAAVVAAYPTADRLYIRMSNKWGVRVEDDITSLDHGFKIIVHRIVEFARAEGRLLDLLGLVWTDRPENLKLNALADDWLTDPDGVRAKYGAAPPTSVASNLSETPPSRPPLEKLINAASHKINIGDFAAGVDVLKQALCRVCIPEVNGTGFLIGRRTVLTNYHVVEPALLAKREGQQVICEFDYFEQTSTPVRHQALAGAVWCKHKSPYSPSDVTGSGEPHEDELDFAVIHLAEPVAETRRVLDIPFSPPLVTLHDYIFIGQHPNGEEAQIAAGQVTENPANGLRYRYDVTTESGSSGSPVLDFGLRLVALHHAADPAVNPRYNQGVPIYRIKRALLNAGLDLMQL
jgi:Trypsin-like peptidase domain/Effector-associated domain 1